jgi:Ser/Thr protein kinase RdoA (MazF antagonist)
MTDLLFSWRCTAAQAQQLVGRAGHWLKIFHSSHVLPRGYLDVDEKLAVTRHIERDRGVRDRVFRRAVTVLRTTARAAATMPLARSWLHGDFKSDNLMISGSRTVGIDIHLRHENAVVYDLAPFLNYIDLRLCHPSGWKLLHSRERLHAAFLRTYFAATPEDVALPLAWVRLYLLLAEWYTAHSNAGSTFRARIIDACYRSVATRVCRAITES